LKSLILGVDHRHMSK